ncbi:MAG: glutamate decarboxylase [Marinilabiliales bacterium]|nr:MAG: glutamate decarboxylase [Marinilabiliales bacterium]
MLHLKYKHSSSKKNSNNSKIIVKDGGIEIPKYKIPAKPMSAGSAYQIVHDECMLDGNARLNLATFVTTHMEPEAQKLMAETMDKNMIDKSEYPQTAEIEKRCVNIIADLWNSHSENDSIGCSTIGSSEACMLGGIALKWRWREKHKLPVNTNRIPNLVLSSGLQVVWEKFCKYWDVEMREVPMEEGNYKLDVDKALEMCDENTIGIVPILGITYTGQYDDVKQLNDKLDVFNKKTGFDIPIHVDAASGGFVAPFIQPKLEWDFRLKWVHSISASGHKYGLVYPGVGWVVWKNEKYLPEDLVFYVDYLGGQMPTMAINFSRPGNQVLAQYYQFLRLGFDGYRQVQQYSQDVAKYLSSKISEIDEFKLVTDGSDIPVFCWTLKEMQKNWTLYDLADRLLMNGWQVPAYAMPENVTDMVVQRIVVKKDMSFDMADMLLGNIIEHLEYLRSLSEPTPSAIEAHKPRDENSKVQEERFHH